MPRIALIAAVLGCAAGAGAPQAAELQPQQDERCEVYAAAITHVVGDSIRPIVIYDSTSLGVPRFAFRAFTTLRAPKADTGFVVTDSLLTLQRTDNQERIPLPECIAPSRRITRLQLDSLRSSFMSGRGGWDAFNAAYPDSRGFLMVRGLHGSRPTAARRWSTWPMHPARLPGTGRFSTCEGTVIGGESRRCGVSGSRSMNL